MRRDRLHQFGTLTPTFLLASLTAVSVTVGCGSSSEDKEQEASPSSEPEDMGAEVSDGGAGGETSSEPQSGGTSSVGAGGDGNDPDPQTAGVAVSEALGAPVDVDGDGQADSIDADDDGLGDYPLVDVDGDGVADGYGVDTDGDEVADEVRDFDEAVAPGLCIQPTGEVESSPLVYVLVDRSSSMFDSGAPWDDLREALLPHFEVLAGHARVGFGSYTGTALECTGLTEEAPIAFDNYDAIESAYDAIPVPVGKAETPTAQSIRQAADVLLRADAGEDVERVLLLVTDGDPDFCDDLTARCAVDASVATLQQIAGEGVRTEVFGLETGGLQSSDYLNYMATAGAGHRPNWEEALNHNDLFGEIEAMCTGSDGWLGFDAVRPDRGEHEPIGEYSTDDSQRTAILLNDARALAEQVSAALEDASRCG